MFITAPSAVLEMLVVQGPGGRRHISVRIKFFSFGSVPLAKLAAKTSGLGDSSAEIVEAFVRCTHIWNLTGDHSQDRASRRLHCQDLIIQAGVFRSVLLPLEFDGD